MEPVRRGRVAAGRRDAERRLLPPHPPAGLPPGRARPAAGRRGGHRAGPPTSWSAGSVWAGRSPPRPGWPSACAGRSPGWPTPPSDRSPCSPCACSAWSGPSRRPGSVDRGAGGCWPWPWPSPSWPDSPRPRLIDGVFVAWWAALRLAGPGRAVWRSVPGPVGRWRGRSGRPWPPPSSSPSPTTSPTGTSAATTGRWPMPRCPRSGSPSCSFPTRSDPIFGFHLPTGVPDTITGTWAYVGGFLSATLVAAGAGRAGRSTPPVPAARPRRMDRRVPAPHLRVPTRRAPPGVRSRDPAHRLLPLRGPLLGARRRRAGRPRLGRPGPEGHPSPGVGGRRLRDRGRRSLGGRDRLAAR